MSTDTITGQISWFSKSKGYGFILTASGEQLFCHHSDIRIDGYKYLKRGEIVTGTKMVMDNGKLKLGNIGPVPGFKLMCEVERREVREG
jgi:CspA family cold shock protein